MTKQAISLLVGTSLALAPLLALAGELSVNANASIDAAAQVGANDTDARAQGQTQAQANLKAAGAEASTTASTDKAKERADKEIARRIEGLNKFNARISNATHISAEGRTGITTMVGAQISELQGLQAKIAGETDAAALKAEVQSITKSYRIFALVMPQLALTAAADRIVDIADAMNGVAGKLEARLNAEVSASSTASSTPAARALADMKVQIAAAQARATEAVNSITPLKPDNGDKAVQQSNLTALKTARAKIQTAQADLVVARKDMKMIMAALKITVSAGASATTTSPATPTP